MFISFIMYVLLECLDISTWRMLSRIIGRRNRVKLRKKTPRIKDFLLKILLRTKLLALRIINTEDTSNLPRSLIIQAR
jgi:hypothetical protein